MAELKTKKNRGSVSAFLKSIPDEAKREDCKKILQLMKSVTKSEPAMWGTSIVGFGQYHYKSKSGQEGVWFQCGFSPRKQNLTLYLMGGLKAQSELLAKLGKHKTSVGCLYIKRLSDIDMNVLKAMIKVCVKNLPNKV